MRLFSNRSQTTSKCGKNISDTQGCASCATFLFLPHFDVICGLLLNRRMATWNLFLKWSTLIIVSITMLCLKMRHFADHVRNESTRRVRNWRIVCTSAKNYTMHLLIQEAFPWTRKKGSRAYWSSYYKCCMGGLYSQKSRTRTPR